jgi:DNA polymerase-3 subunit delta
MPSTFTLVTGDDDYLVEREARARFDKMTAGVTDDMAKEVIDASCTKVADTEDTLGQIKSAVQTMSLFGDKKYVWIKNFNWIADSQLGKAEGTKLVVEQLLEVLKGIEPDGVELIISAYPLDGRKREAKLLKELGETVELKAGKDAEALAERMVKEGAALGVTLDFDAARTLVQKVNGSLRMMESELRKLACYAGEGGNIEARTVVEMVPTFGEGDFFEPVEAFFDGDLPWTLEALHRYFYQNDEARPLIASLQSRVRLLIQLRAMMDAGAIKLGSRGIPQSDFSAAQRTYAHHYPDEAAKVKYNVFAANLWYLGNKVAPSANKFTLKKLVDIQLALVDAFTGILERPNDQESVMREFAVKCLSGR